MSSTDETLDHYHFNVKLKDLNKMANSVFPILFLLNYLNYYFYLISHSKGEFSKCACTDRKPSYFAFKLFC